MIADNDEGNEGSQPAPKKSRASKPIKKSAVVISDVAEIPVEAASSPHTAKESGGATVSKPKKAPTGKKNEITPDKGNEGHEDEEDGEVLKMGDKLPSIKLNDEEGNTVDVSTLIGEKGVVFFLYPKVGPFWMEVRIHHLLMELKADTQDVLTKHVATETYTTKLQHSGMRFTDFQKILQPHSKRYSQFAPFCQAQD